MVRKIKPQKITESCYFSLLPSLCPSVVFVVSVVFQDLISKYQKVSSVLVTTTQDTKGPVQKTFVKLLGVKM